MGWGYQPERVQAGIYLLFHTLLASLPFLVGILFVYNSLGGGAVTQWLRCCATNRKVAGSIPACVIGNFH